jgi:hypothetical protein
MSTDACPEQPSYVAVAARLTGRGLSDFDAVSWLHRTVREITERDASLATLTPGEWEQLWARAGAASASDLKRAPERTDDAIRWPAD